MSASVQQSIPHIIGIYTMASSTAEMNSQLIQAEVAGNLVVVRTLIDKGANIEATDINGDTVLLLALEHSHIEIVKELLYKGASIDAVNKNGWSALTLYSDCDETAETQLINAVASSKAEIKKSIETISKINFFKELPLEMSIKIAGHTRDSVHAQDVAEGIAIEHLSSLYQAENFAAEHPYLTFVIQNPAVTSAGSGLLVALAVVSTVMDSHAMPIIDAVTDISSSVASSYT